MTGFSDAEAEALRALGTDEAAIQGLHLSSASSLTVEALRLLQEADRQVQCAGVPAEDPTAAYVVQAYKAAQRAATRLLAETNTRGTT